MAEDQEILDELEAAEEAAAGKSPIMKILGGIVALTVLGGGGWYAYTNFFQAAPSEVKPADQTAAPAGEIPKEGETASSAGKEEDVSPNLGVMYSLDPFIVNLAGSGGKRFLKVTISLELSAPTVHTEIKQNAQKITDSILVLLSSKTFEDVYSVQGKFRLKDEITTRVNRFLALGHIKDAYFTEFIIQ
jgi:flagellar protein FliL